MAPDRLTLRCAVGLGTCCRRTASLPPLTGLIGLGALAALGPGTLTPRLDGGLVGGAGWGCLLHAGLAAGTLTPRLDWGLVGGAGWGYLLPAGFATGTIPATIAPTIPAALPTLGAFLRSFGACFTSLHQMFGLLGAGAVDWW